MDTSPILRAGALAKKAPPFRRHHIVYFGAFGDLRRTIRWARRWAAGTVLEVPLGTFLLELLGTQTLTVGAPHFDTVENRVLNARNDLPDIVAEPVPTAWRCRPCSRLPPAASRT